MGVGQQYELVFSFLQTQMVKHRNIYRDVCMHRVCSAQPCSTVCDPMDCSLPGSSVHTIFQARILEQVAISPSRGSSRPRDRTHVSCVGRQILYPWATWEVYTEQYMHIFLLCELRGAGSNDIPAAMSTLGTQILVSNTILWGQGLLRGMTAFGTGAWNIQDEPSTEHLRVQENKEMLKTTAAQTSGWNTPCKWEMEDFLTWVRWIVIATLHALKTWALVTNS